MTRANRDLWVCTASAVVCAAVALLVPVTAVRTLFAVPLCLVLPGYALTCAMFAGVELDFGARAMLVLGLDFAALVLGALVLNFTPWGLRPGTWTVWLLFLTAAGAVGAVRRRHRRILAGAGQPEEQPDGQPDGQPDDQPGRRPSPLRVRLPAAGQLALLGAAALLAAGTMVFAHVVLPAPNAIGYTALWALPEGTGAGPALRIGVQSEQRRSRDYTLRLSLSSGQTVVLASGHVLAPAQRWEMLVPLRRVLGRAPAPSSVTVELFRAGATTPDRTVTARVPSLS